MAKELTAADLADYQVEVTTSEGTQTRTVRAAYDTIEPGWLLFKDHEHRTVARFSGHIVIGTERMPAG